MENGGRSRRRGVVFTPAGLRRLAGARRQAEARENQGDPFSREELAHRTGLSLRTLAKALEGRIGVDRPSLEACFRGFDLVLERADYRFAGTAAAGDVGRESAAGVEGGAGAEGAVGGESTPSRKEGNAGEEPEAAAVDWGEAPEITAFHGRGPELAALQDWLAGDRPCRLVAVLGMGGLGKTTLATRALGSLVGPAPAPFRRGIWRSLRNAPRLEALLDPLLSALAPAGESLDRPPLDRLLPVLRQHSLLLVLDDWETVLDGGREGRYRPGYEPYGELLRLFAGPSHRSALLLTSREKPLELADFETEPAAARSLQLAGSQEAALALLAEQPLRGSDGERRQLAERCCHSPLAVKLVAASIRDLFGGAIGAYLAQEAPLPGGLRHLLEQQLLRLSPLEHTLLLWLAIHRDGARLDTLGDCLVPPQPRARVAEVLEALARRSLIEVRQGRFSLQPVVLEQAGTRLVEQLGEALLGETSLQPLHSFPVLLAEAPDALRESQRQLLLEPLLAHLRARLGTRTAVAARLRRVLTDLPRPADPEAAPDQEPEPEPGYAAGTVLNLLRELGADLSGLDLAGLAVWQAHLAGVPLPRVDLRGADLRGTVFTRPIGAVFGLATHPDGQRFATCEIGGMVRLWLLADGQPLWSVAAARQWVWTLEFHPAGTLLATGGGEATIGLWDVESGRPAGRLEGHGDQVYGLAFDPTGRHLASASGDGTVRLWDLATGRTERVLEDHAGAVLAVAFDPSGRWLLSGGADGELRLWEVGSDRPSTLLGRQDDQLRCLAVAPTGDRVASGGGDGWIRLWSLPDGAPLGELTGHGAHVLSLQYSPCGTTLASSSSDTTIRLWDAGSGKPLSTLAGQANWTRTVRWCPDGRTLLSGCSDYSVRLWEAQSGRPLRSWRGSSNWIWRAEFSGDGQRIVTGGGDGSVRLWPADGGPPTRTLRGHSAWVIAVCSDPSGRWIASAGDLRVHLWEAASGRPLRRLEGHTSHVHALAFSPVGALLASAGSDYTARLWDPATGACLRVLEGHRDWIRALAFSADGRWLASAGHDATVRVWEVATGRCVGVLEEFGAWVMGVSFLAGGEELVCASGSELSRWNWRRRERLGRYRGHGNWIRGLHASADGRWLASGDSDGMLLLWSVKREAPLRRCTGHGAQILSVRFDPAGESVVSGSADETAKVWDRASGRCLATLRPEPLCAGLRIAGARGLTEATRASLRSLGAIDEPDFC